MNDHPAVTGSTSNTALTHELQIALDAVALASARIMNDYATFVAIPDAPVSISTDTDRASQDIIIQHLAQHFPGDAFCAEEATTSLAQASKTGARVWIIDPIDGTRGFAMKNGEFSVMVGLVIAGEIEVAVVGEPARARITFASRGKGCWVRHGNSDAIKCQVTTTGKMADATLVQSHVKPGRPDPVVTAFQPAKCVETYSAGVKLAMVARGEVDLYVNTYSQFADWDICAGHHLVVEAGGKVSELSGRPVTYGKPGYAQKGGLLATNGVLHPEAISLLATAGHD